MSESDSFQVRVKNAIKGNYRSCMRRSLQSVALYEADRCLKGRYPQLRPFQKKYALITTTVDLLNTLDFLNDYHRQEIMFRTNASKEPLGPDLAWRRMKLLTREINQTILPKAKEMIENDENSEKSHDEICALVLQRMFEDNTVNTKPHPPMWEYNHTNVFTVYRIYYRGVVVDPAIFPAKPPRVVEVPAKRPADRNTAGENGGDAQSIPLAQMTIGAVKRGKNVEMSDEERRAMLQEVKDHTELLKQFEGVIPGEELAARKRALFAALPPVPPPVGEGRKQRKKAKGGNVAAVVVAAAAAAPEATKPSATEEEDWEKLGSDDNGLEPPKKTMYV